VPTNNEVKTYARGSATRGKGGAWKEQEPHLFSGEKVVGTPVSLPLTDKDLVDIEEAWPSRLFQKLARRVEGITTLRNQSFGEALSRIKQEAYDDAGSLAQYIAGVPTYVDVPVVTILPQPVSFSQPEPEPLPVLEAEPTVTPIDIPDGLWPQLSIPMLSEMKHYYMRTFPGGKTEADVYDFARSEGVAVGVYGHAGTGKTSSAKNYAALRGLPFVRFECNPQVDEEVVQGQYMPSGVGNQLVWRYSALAKALSVPSVILLNESNRMGAKANSLFLGIMEERELQVSRHKNEVIKVHPECLIIADANPGYRGTVQSDQAFLDRLRIKLEFEYDIEIEKNFIPSPTLLTFAQSLRDDAEREDRWSTPISTRLLQDFVSSAHGLDYTFAVDSFIKAFPTEERDALRMLFEVHSELISTELGVTA